MQEVSHWPARLRPRGEGRLGKSLERICSAIHSHEFLKLGIVGFLLSLFTHTIGAAGGYQIVFLGELREAGSTLTHGMNHCGQVVGESGGIDGDREKAFVWKEGSSIQGLEGLPGGDYSQAFGVNDQGLIIGSSNATTTVRAVLWTLNGKIHEIGTLAGDTGSQAFAINNHGQVVGFSSGPQGTRAFLWTKEGGTQNLGGLPGTDYTLATAINDSGQVAGRSGTTVATHACLWVPGRAMRDLGTLPGDRTSQAMAINNLGQVVGFSHGPHGTRAFLWTESEGMVDLGVLPGGDFSEALGINDAGQVVGMSGGPSGARGFLWTSYSGMKDLNTMLPPDLDVSLAGAFAINDRGQIAGYGGPSHVHMHHFNAPRAYLLTPFGASASEGGAACSGSLSGKSSQGDMPGMSALEPDYGSHLRHGDSGMKNSAL
jgi:probable HAF family extracellular repeat protein